MTKLFQTTLLSGTKLKETHEKSAIINNKFEVKEGAEVKQRVKNGRSLQCQTILTYMKNPCKLKVENLSKQFGMKQNILHSFFMKS